HNYFGKPVSFIGQKMVLLQFNDNSGNYVKTILGQSDISDYLYTLNISSYLSAIVYYIALPFIYLLSLLPFPLLYLLSDFLFVVLYHIVGYRKEVVLTNLRNSFPGKSEE